MAQQVKGLAATPNNPGSSPGPAWWKKRTDFRKCPLASTSVLGCVCVSVYELWLYLVLTIYECSLGKFYLSPG